MKKQILAGLMLSLIAAAPVHARTNTYFGFQIGIGNAPPPPRVRFYREPDVVLVPQSRVYVVENDPGYDVFRYGPYWYVENDGYWYRARNYRGPYRVVDVRIVPRPIFAVPAGQWRHRDWDHSYVTERRGWGNGKHGHGHGRGHGGDWD